MDNNYLLDTNAKLQSLNETLQEIVEAINNLTIFIYKLGNK